MRTTKEIFSENLTNLLIAKNKKQADLARFTGATTATVSNWCNNIAMPRSNMIDKICVFLGCTVEDLTVDHTKPVQLAPEDIIAEELRENPLLMRLMFQAMKLTPAQLEDLVNKVGGMK